MKGLISFKGNLCIYLISSGTGYSLTVMKAAKKFNKNLSIVSRRELSHAQPFNFLTSRTFKKGLSSLCEWYVC